MSFSEQQILPYAAVQAIGPGPVLVLAPHPDDEVFGCGGALLRHVAAGDRVRVIILTDGAYGADASGEYPRRRQQESLEAAVVLGYGTPLFWGLPDRGLEYGEALIRRLLESIEETAAALVYAPSWREAHPDHSALALAAAEAVRRCRRPLRLVLYEVGIPLSPNTLLDITDLLERKRQAMACFTSQLARQPYDRQILALNRFRTYTLPDTVQAAEAYRVLNRDALDTEPPGRFDVQQAGFDRPLDAMARILAEREARIAELEIRLAAREREITERDALLADTRAQLDEVYRSRSWRLTAAYRWLGGKFRKASDANQIND